MKSLTRGRNARLIVGMVIIGIYLPYSWLLFSHSPWSPHTWEMIKMWPVLPGFVINFMAGAVVPRQWITALADTNFKVFAFHLLLTVIVLGASISAMLKARNWFWPLGFCIFGVSCAMGWFAYAAWRA